MTEGPRTTYRTGQRIDPRGVRADSQHGRLQEAPVRTWRSGASGGQKHLRLQRLSRVRCQQHRTAWRGASARSGGAGSQTNRVGDANQLSDGRTVKPIGGRPRRSVGGRVVLPACVRTGTATRSTWVGPSLLGASSLQGCHRPGNQSVPRDVARRPRLRAGLRRGATSTQAVGIGPIRSRLLQARLTDRFDTCRSGWRLAGCRACPVVEGLLVTTSERDPRTWGLLSSRHAAAHYGLPDRCGFRAPAHSEEQRHRDRVEDVARCRAWRRPRGRHRCRRRIRRRAHGYVYRGRRALSQG